MRQWCEVATQLSRLSLRVSVSCTTSDAGQFLIQLSETQHTEYADRQTERLAVGRCVLD